MTEIVDSSDERSFISIPCPPDQMGNFIAGLLGKSQIIRKTYQGNFSVAREEIIHMHTLIFERINEQSSFSLVQLSIMLLYNDGSSVELGSIAQFENYSEIRPLICVGISYSSVFLVKFSGKDFPERQQIEIDFRIANSDRETGEAKTYLFDSIASFARKYEDLINRDETKKMSGMVAFRISHTTRSWGSDIENLLDGAIKQILQNDQKSKFRKAVEDSREVVSFLAAAAIALIVFQFFWNLSSDEKSNFLASRGFVDNLHITMMNSIEDKINFLVYRQLNSQYRSSFDVLTFFGSMGVCLGFTFLFSRTLRTNKPSFLLMSKQSLSYRDTKLRQYNSSYAKFLSGIVIAFLINIASNIVFYYIW